MVLDRFLYGVLLAALWVCFAKCLCGLLTCLLDVYEDWAERQLAKIREERGLDG